MEANEAFTIKNERFPSKQGCRIITEVVLSYRGPF